MSLERESRSAPLLHPRPRPRLAGRPTRGRPPNAAKQPEPITTRADQILFHFIFERRSPVFPILEARNAAVHPPSTASAFGSRSPQLTCFERQDGLHVAVHLPASRSRDHRV